MRCPRLGESPVCGCCFAYPSRPWRVGGWRSSAGSGLVMPQSRSRSPQPPVTSPVLWLGARVCCPRPSVSTASARCCVGRALPRRAVLLLCPGLNQGRISRDVASPGFLRYPEPSLFFFTSSAFQFAQSGKENPMERKNLGAGTRSVPRSTSLKGERFVKSWERALARRCLRCFF